MPLHLLRNGHVTLIFLAWLNTPSTGLETSSVCGSSPISPVYLECNDTERIHVQSITYKKTTKNCEALPQQQQCEVTRETRRASYSTVCEGLPQNCKVAVQKGGDTFSTSCNGRSRCWETLSDFWMVETCGKSSIIVTVTYECISDYVIDVCNEVTFMPQGTKVFLSSPNFINPARLGPKGPCICDIEGDGLTGEILELYLIQRDGRRANLTIITDTTAWRSQDHKPVAYNDVIIETTNKLRLQLDSMQLYGQVVWIRIKGKSLKVLCNGGSQVTIGNGIPVSTSASLPGYQAIKGSSVSEPSVAPLVILIAVVVLAFIVVVLLVYILCRYRERNQSNYSINQFDDSVASYIKFDYISNTSSLPDESSDHRMSYDLAGTDPFDAVNAAPSIEGPRRIEDQRREKGLLKQELNNPGCEASIGEGQPTGDDDAVYEDVELKEVQGLGVTRSPDPFLLQRD